MLLYDLFQLYNIFPKIVERIPGKHKKLFALLQKAQDYVKNQAEIRLKHLDANSTPQDYTEAFMIKMIQVKCWPWETPLWHCDPKKFIDEEGQFF